MPDWREFWGLGLNRRERTALLLLTATFLVGSIIAGLKRARVIRAASAVSVVQSAAADTAAADSALPAGPIDLNTASARQLEALPGIGPVLAGRILEYRRLHGGFKSVRQLRQVSGIGPKRLAALEGLVTTVIQSAAPTPSLETIH